MANRPEMTNSSAVRFPLTRGGQHIVMDYGTELDLNPGDAFVIRPGYDRWVVGDEPAVALDWYGADANRV